MNDFEKYIRDNKNKLELDEINPEIWLRIENTVLKQKNRRNIFYLKMVAAAAIALLAVIVLNSLYINKPELGQAQLLERYGLEQYDFPAKVSIRTQNLAQAKIPVDRKEDFEILLQQLEFLDAQYQDYLDYLEQHGFQEFIGKQILQYYRSKIELLDKIQYEIEKINHYENKYNKESPTVPLNI